MMLTTLNACLADMILHPTSDDGLIVQAMAQEESAGKPKIS